MLNSNGMYNTRIFRCYRSMRYRCLYPTCKDYKHYGGRGISICPDWLDEENGFINFYTWAMDNGYNDTLTLDRIDVNGNYEPTNCRWADIVTQRNNMRSNIVLTYEGKTMTLKSWSRYLGISYSALCDRYRRGCSVPEILDTHVRCSRKYVEFNGESKSVHDWAKIFRIKQDTLSARLKRAKYNMHDVYINFVDMHEGYDNYKDNSEITNYLNDN